MEFMKMGAVSLLSCFLIFQLTTSALGEPSYYRQYRILSGSPYSIYHSPQQYSLYTNPYVQHPYRYSQPARDDNIYINDQYGRTTVQSGANYRAMSYVTTTCTANTCGQNAQCQVISGRPVCSCLRGYSGDPLSYCKRAECLDDNECRGESTCRNGKCIDPCAGTCGPNALCNARRGIPTCSCPPGYTGDAITSCRRFDPEELCHPSPCGQNTNCEIRNGVPTCLCQPGYHGSPLAGCRHECESDAECGPSAACIKFKCQNPCLTQCGTNAECETINNHQAVCKCPKNYFGNPYSSCKPECYGDNDCPSNKPACFYGICKSPCDGACGVGANCELRGLTPVCSCPKDMTGDPFTRCRPFEPKDLCEPNPCGSNAHCEPGFDRYNKERPVCTCPFGYTGDPLKACFKGECTDDNQCADSQACIEYSCRNPCVNQCGVNANCNARRHIAGITSESSGRAQLAIINGVTIYPHSLPYLVFLNITSTSGSGRCGGALISRNYVLTSARCLDGVDSVEAVFGVHSISSTEEKHISIISTNFTIHYDFNSTTLENDIALITLPQAVTLNDNIQPIAIGEDEDIEELTGTTAESAGWGLQSSSYEDSYSDTPLALFLKIISNYDSDCDGEFGDRIQDTNICCDIWNSWDGPLNLCTGDFGAPLVKDRNKLIGVASFTGEPCIRGLPNVFTSVVKYRTWLLVNSDAPIQ